MKRMRKAAAFAAKTLALGLCLVGVLVMPAGLFQLAAGGCCLLAGAVVYGAGARLEDAAACGRAGGKPAERARR